MQVLLSLAALMILLAPVVGRPAPGAANTATGTYQPAPQRVRVGYQKYGTLILLKARGTLEPRLAARGSTVEWAEFSYGPPMLEALNADHIDFAGSGETPPVFARAGRGSNFVYVGYEAPSPAGEAIVVPQTSTIRSVADLKGKRVAVARGSNSHYLLARALLAAGVADGDVRQVDLTPADARAAFQSGAVDAWAVWDYHLAAAEHALGARILVDGRNLVNNTEIYSSRAEFAARHPELLGEILDEIARTDAWVSTHTEQAAELLDSELHVGVAVLSTALRRRGYGVRPADRELTLAQQTIADTLYFNGILPHPVEIGTNSSTLESHQP